MQKNGIVVKIFRLLMIAIAVVAIAIYVKQLMTRGFYIGGLLKFLCLFLGAEGALVFFGSMIAGAIERYIQNQDDDY